MKKASESTTIRFNGFSAVLLLGALLAMLVYGQQHLGELPIPEDVATWISFGLGTCIAGLGFALANVGLRFRTYEPIEGSQGEIEAEIQQRRARA